MIKQPLNLSNREPVARGSHRIIFDIDEAQQLLVKVMLPSGDLDQRWSKRVKRWLKRRYPHAEFRFLFREYNYYIRAKLVEQRMQETMPISEVRGLISTSHGVGMLVEKIVDSEGKLARKLADLFLAGELPAYLRELNDFVRRMFEWNIVANDINTGNIVWGCRDGEPQFVLVDGWGDSHLIPLRTWFSVMNRRSLDKRFRAVARQCGLHWDPRKKQFLLVTLAVR